jgi:hypothetical protein
MARLFSGLYLFATCMVCIEATALNFFVTSGYTSHRANNAYLLTVSPDNASFVSSNLGVFSVFTHVNGCVPPSLMGSYLAWCMHPLSNRP